MIKNENLFINVSRSLDKKWIKCLDFKNINADKNVLCCNKTNSFTGKYIINVKPDANSINVFIFLFRALAEGYNMKWCFWKNMLTLIKNMTALF